MSEEDKVSVKVPRIRYEISEDVSLNKDIFKFYFGDKLIYNLLMRFEGLSVTPYDTKCKCLYNIFLHDNELLMLFLLQLESEGKI